MNHFNVEDHRDDSQEVVIFPKIGTNQAAILLMFLEGERLTNRQVGQKLDSVSSGSRISELRANNWPIESKKIPYRTSVGKHVYYCEYTLDNLQKFHTDPRVKKFVEIQSGKK